MPIDLDVTLSRHIAAVCPIFVRDPSGVVGAWASGVFISIDNRKFLLTAAHVTDRVVTGDLLVPGTERPIYLEGFHTSGPLPKSNRRKDDLLDIAYIQLQEDFVARLHPFFAFLDMDDIDLFDTTKSGDVYSMIGYPGGEPSLSGELLSRERYTFTGDARDPQLYCKHHSNIESHILVHFPLGKIKRVGAASSVQSRRRDGAPHPSGMSGGAVVALSNPKPGETDTRPLARLAGILTTYHASDHTFIATRINGFIHCILKNYPDIPVKYSGAFTHNRNA